jgi:hypothetical protein
VLGELFALSKRYKLELLVSQPDTADSTVWNCHPKVFVVEDARGASVLIGSANMTGGGLATNHEASIWVRDGCAVMIRRLDQHIKRLLKG